MDSRQIENRGYTNIGDALQEVPSFGVPAGNRVGGQAGSFGSGQTFVDFFGLGSQRTLTVVNGRRFVSSNSASIFGPTGAGSQVDYNIIPTIIIDRVETIAVGGAPIYGSDAIAGTVNMITRRDFEGLRLDSQYGISERGDASEFRIRGMAGLNFAGGRGNITIAGEYNEEGGLTNFERLDKRLNSSFTSPLGDSPFDNIYIEDRRIPALNEFGVPLVNDSIGIPLSPGQADDFGVQPGVTDVQGRPVAFDRNGNLVPIEFGERTGNTINFNGGNGFLLPANLLTPVRRYLATALAQYEVTDNIRAFAEGWYANSRGQQLRDQPVYNTGLFDVAGAPDGNLILSVDNPFLSPAARQTIINSLATNPATDADPGTFYLGRANTDLVSGAGTSTVELYRIVGGIDGNYNVLGRDLRFELVGNYGRSTTEGSERVLVQQNFANAINAVRDASGNIVCAPGAVNAAIPTLSSTCAPINPFGQQISQAARDYVTAIADPRQVNEQWVITASTSGSLFELPGGDVGFAIGYEHRYESADFDPGAFYFGEVDPADPTGARTQFGRSVPIDPVSGSFNTDEVFGELTVPIIGRDMDVPLISSLELHGAARYIDNSLAGGDWTYTGDVRYAPIEGLTFRGNYTRSVRAPAITELFNPRSQIFTTANDPCDARFINVGPDPATRQANCAAAGIPAGFESSIVDFTSRGSLSGNTDLQNEKADAYTVGVIFQPRFLPGFNLTVDWVDIQIEGAIETLDATQVLEGCFDSASYPSDICGNITRDAAGQVTFIETGFANAARLDFQGLVAQVDYRIETPFLGDASSITLGGQYQYLDTLVTRVGEGDRSTLSNSIGYSPHKGTLNASYANEGFSWLVQWLYYGETLIDPDAPSTTYEFPKVPSVSFFNSTLAHRINDQFSVRLVVNNVLNEEPPFPVPAAGGTRTYFPAFLGRNFRFGASVNF